MDEAYSWMALRYIERNPVRANLVECATDWPCSSAAAHLGQEDNTGLLDLTDWQTNHPLAAWREALQMPEDEDVLTLLRTTTHTGRPLGDDNFLDQCEKIAGQRLRALKVGRPRTEVLEIDK